MNLLLWAQAGAEVAAENEAPAASPFAFGGPIFIYALFGMAIIFLFVLPGRRQRREQAAMLAALKPGAKIVTSSGIIGVVVKVKDTEDELTLRSEDAKIKVLKSSVARVLSTDEAIDSK